MSSSGWEVRFSNSRQLPYFFNSGAGLSVWEKPEDITDEQVSSLPGAHYLKSGGEGAAKANGSSDSAPAGKVRASHLLVKHSGSRRPSSWKEVRRGMTRRENYGAGMLTSLLDIYTE
jgi:NIMA-interacting peptidyl-prolyl cis-trans isomerase 1